jgi:hypothetical protein
MLPAGAAPAGSPQATIQTVAQVYDPRGLGLLPGGGFLVAEPFANLVQRVAPDGTVTTVAGTGAAGYGGDGASAAAAELDFVHGVAALPDGGFLVMDTLNHRVRRVAPDGTISTVAGTGESGGSGDGGPATLATIDDPRGIAALPDGGFLIPDSGNNRIRRVWPDGSITTVAGNGTAGYAGDGGPATAAELNLPFGVGPLPDGGFLIADKGNDRIRRVLANGTIETVAGNGLAGFAGDGGLAVDAELQDPHDVAVTPDGGFLIADEGNNRVRRVLPNGTIETTAGTGVAGFAGDGGSAAQAELNQPKNLAVLPDGRGFLVSDFANDRVREVFVDLRPALTLTVAHTLRARAGRSFRVAYTLNAAARVRLEIRRGTRLVRGLRLTGRKGMDVVTLRPLPVGLYALRLAADGGDGRSVSASGSLVVAP